MYHSDKHGVIWVFFVVLHSLTKHAHESMTGFKNTLYSLYTFDTHPILTFFSFYLRKTTELALDTQDLGIIFLTLQSFW